MLDDEARRARQREYSRRSRARAKERVQEALRAAETGAPGALSEALEVSISAMKWIEPSDGALVALARLQARQADALLAVNSSSGSAAALRYLSAFHRTLQELGGTPRVRLQYELRSRRLEALKPAPVTSISDARASQLTRPPKRRSQ